MWIYTPTGFISAVAKRPDSTDLTVRARDRQSLDGLVALSGEPATLGEGTDYPYRVVVSRETFKFWLDRQVEDLDYGNFKDEAKAVSGGHYADVLAKVWVANLDLEDAESNDFYLALARGYRAAP